MQSFNFQIIFSLEQVIATCIMVLKKSKSENKTLFIDASKECVKVTNSNKLTVRIFNLYFKPMMNKASVDHVANLLITMI
jgi:type I restriction enzyme M protein